MASGDLYLKIRYHIFFKFLSTVDMLDGNHHILGFEKHVLIADTPKVGK